MQGNYFRIFPYITKKVFISGCEITQKNFQGLFHSSSNCEELFLYNCRINYKELKFRKDIKYSIKTVRFNACCPTKDKSVEKEPLKIRVILKAISKCGLKDSIKNMELLYDMVDKNMAYKLVKKYNLTGIVITGVAESGKDKYKIKL